jgi:Cu-processing system permease protein
MIADVVTIARLEFTTVARLKWIRLLTAAFALLTAAAAYSAGAADELSGADGFERTTVTLIPVVLILVPLAALVLGVSGHTMESGSEAFLFAQPLGRTTVLVGRWLGEAAALGCTIGAGFGLGAMLVVFSSGANGLARFVFFVAATAALALIFLSIAAAIAAATDTRATALGLGTFVWFFFVLLYDGAVLSAAGWLTGSLGGRVIFASVFGNPVDVVRVAMLSMAGVSNALGATGDAWVRFLGGTAFASVATVGAVALWITMPLALAAGALTKRDL